MIHSLSRMSVAYTSNTILKGCHSFSPRSLSSISFPKHLFTSGSLKRKVTKLYNQNSIKVRFVTFSTPYAVNPLNKKDKAGDTPLLCAIKSGADCYDICKMLLDAGADPNLPDAHGLTPLDSAIASKNLDVVNLLLEYGSKRSSSISH